MMRATSASASARDGPFLAVSEFKQNIGVAWLAWLAPASQILAAQFGDIGWRVLREIAPEPVNRRRGILDVGIAAIRVLLAGDGVGHLERATVAVRIAHHGIVINHELVSPLAGARDAHGVGWHGAVRGKQVSLGIAQRGFGRLAGDLVVELVARDAFAQRRAPDPEDGRDGDDQQEHQHHRKRDAAGAGVASVPEGWGHGAVAHKMALRLLRTAYTR